MEAGFGQDLFHSDVEVDGEHVFDDEEREKLLVRMNPDVLEIPRFNITPTKVLLFNKKLN